MNAWTVKQGNTSVQDVAIKDSAGVLVTTLAEADEVIFQVRKSFTSPTIIIEKTLGDGIEVDTPLLGYIRISLTADDTDIDVGTYCMALQITWHPASGNESGTLDEVYEVIIKVNNTESSKFIVIQDMI